MNYSVRLHLGISVVTHLVLKFNVDLILISEMFTTFFSDEDDFTV